MLVKPREIAEVMGGSKVLGREVNTLSELDDVVSAGLPLAVESLVRMKINGSFNLVTPSGKEVEIDKPSSELLERIVRIFLYAEQVFGSEKQAADFLHNPHPLLDEMTPLKKLHSELGGREVEQILVSIEFGLPA